MRLSLLISGVLALPGPWARAGEAVLHKPALSQVYRITRKYKSMEGPASAQRVVLMEGRPPELVWITGFRTEIVGEDGASPMSPEFMCHINLDSDMEHHKRLFGWTKNVSPRFFTLSQAQFGLELPQGFGVPVMSDEPFLLGTQVLNHNFDNADFQVRHKVTVDFVRDRDAKTPMKPLFATNAYGMKLLEGKDGRFGSPFTEPAEKGVSCLPGEHAPAAAGSSVYPDSFGRTFSGHWVVKPGREVNHTDVTQALSLPFDTTIHYINIHLHPFAQSLELRDTTTGRTVFKSRVTNPRGRIGLEEVESLSSAEGLPVYKDHRYELISVYNNTSRVDQDAMATMFFYLFDKEFKKPDPAGLAAGHSHHGDVPVLHGDDEPEPLPSNEAWVILRSNVGDTVLSVARDVASKTVSRISRLAGSGAYANLVESLDKDFGEPPGEPAPAPPHAAAGPRLILRTVAGDLVVGLFPDVAPKTVTHILDLARAGAYDTTHFHRLEPGYLLQTTMVAGRSTPLTERQRALVRNVPLEAGALRHTRGVLSLARYENDPNSGESSFSILLGDAPALDGKYTIFGRVESGFEVLEALEKAPRDDKFRPRTVLTITKAEVVEPEDVGRLKLAGVRPLP